MFERFSRGYYLGRLYVEPTEADAPAMCRAQHEQVEEQLYGPASEGTPAESEGDPDTPPLVMKLDTRHFPVQGDEGVPRDTLVVPADLLGDTRIRNPPALREVLLAKADRARQLLDLAAGSPSADAEDEADDAGDGFRPGGPAI